MRPEKSRLAGGEERAKSERRLQLHRLRVWVFGHTSPLPQLPTSLSWVLPGSSVVSSDVFLCSHQFLNLIPGIICFGMGRGNLLGKPSRKERLELCFLGVSGHLTLANRDHLGCPLPPAHLSHRRHIYTHPHPRQVWTSAFPSCPEKSDCPCLRLQTSDASSGQGWWLGIHP